MIATKKLPGTILVLILNAFSVAHAIQDESEQDNSKQLETAELGITKTIDAINKIMSEVGPNTSKDAVLAKCGLINRYFKKVDDTKIPTNISEEFKAAKNNFATFYKLLNNNKELDLEDLKDTVSDSGAEYGNSWRAMIDVAKNAGYKISDVGPVDGRADDPKMSERDPLMNKLQLLKTAASMFLLDTGQYPATLEDLVKEPAKLAGKNAWRGPYYESKNVAIRDKWGTKCAIEVDMETGKIIIKSAGPDKKFGTDDDVST